MADDQVVQDGQRQLNAAWGLVQDQWTVAVVARWRHLQTIINALRTVVR